VVPKASLPSLSAGIRALRTGRTRGWRTRTGLEGRSLCPVVSDRKPDSFSSSFLACISALCCRHTADRCITGASSTGKIPREVFPCCHRVAPWIVSCKYAYAAGNHGFPSPSQGRVFGRSGLKLWTGSFISTCLWSVQKQLMPLSSKLFYSF